MSHATNDDPPLTVSQLSRRISTALESGIEEVTVVGQVNRLSAKKHWYFPLTDGESTIDCVMWASKAPRDWEPAQGDEVIATGRVGHYAPNGRTQLYVDTLRDAAGKGDLQKAYEALVRELRDLGWFEDDRKQPLPAIPQHVAVITSAGSAAAADVIETARRRWSAVALTIVNVPVQGEAAAASVAAAIAAVDAHLDVDTIIVTRGGGSLEDLWSFNERVVAEAVVACSTPLVAAIGHESDTTIIELVADLRASTPTAAAMAVIPEASELSHQVEQGAFRLHATAQRQVHARIRRLADAEAALAARRPHAMLRRRHERLLTLLGHVRGGLQRHLAGQSRRLEGASRALAAIDPSAVLARGWSLTRRADGTLVRSVTDVTVDDPLTTLLADGSITTKVTATAQDDGVECPP